MDVRERMDLIIKHSGLSQNAFAKKIGVSPMAVSCVGRKTPQFSVNMQNSILSVFPDISKDWLLTGKGGMLISDNEEAKVIANVNFIQVPLVNTYASAGFLKGYADVAYMDTLPLYTTMERELSIDIAFEVQGDSMESNDRDSYFAGDILLCHELDAETFRSYESRLDRYSFVVVHTDGILVKKIKSVDETEMVLHSLNPIYKDFAIKLSDVKKIYRIVKSDRYH